MEELKNMTDAQKAYYLHLFFRSDLQDMIDAIFNYCGSIRENNIGVNEQWSVKMSREELNKYTNKIQNFIVGHQGQLRQDPIYFAAKLFGTTKYATVTKLCLHLYCAEEFCNNIDLSNFLGVFFGI